MAHPFTKTANVTDAIDNVLEAQYNSLRAELRALMCGLEFDDDASITIAYSGWRPTTITIADAQGDDCDITCVRTITWTGWKPTQYADVYDAGEINKTVTTTLTWTGNKLTGISRAIT